MKIVLAYPYEGHDPDDEIDVDETVGRRMISEGFARHPEQTVAELRQYAKDAGINLRGASKRDEIEAAIQAAEKTRASKTTTVLPDTGTTEGEG